MQNCLQLSAYYVNASAFAIGQYLLEAVQRVSQVWPCTVFWVWSETVCNGPGNHAPSSKGCWMWQYIMFLCLGLWPMEPAQRDWPEPVPKTSAHFNNIIGCWSPTEWAHWLVQAGSLQPFLQSILGQ